MADNPSVLIVDDGELGDVRRLLDELGVAYRHLRGGAVPTPLAAPQALLVSTARRAALRRQGYDFLVRPPVHRESLRLLLLRTLYTGEERRRDARVSVGSEVSLRRGMRRGAAQPH